MTTQSWSIPGSDGEAILGDSHVPAQSPRGVVLLAHGFKGYKDYGFLPWLAEELAGAGFIAHRYNFSHSGMTNRIDTFERPDLFERDTWSRQVFDLTAVANAARLGCDGFPDEAVSDQAQVWFGHSRGGVTALLAAARSFESAGPVQPAGVITAAAPDQADGSLDETQRAMLRRAGYLPSPSARTGQTLRVGRTWLDEQEADPQRFDPSRAAGQLACPVLIIHGSDDPTVPVDAADRLTEAAGDNARKLIIEDTQHTFNAPNPWDWSAPPPPACAGLRDGIIDFLIK